MATEPNQTPEPVAPKLTVWEKYVELFSSQRFHLLVVGFLIQTAKHYNYIDSYLADTLTALVATVVGVGTVDRFNQKPAPPAPGVEPKKLKK